MADASRKRLSVGQKFLIGAGIIVGLAGINGIANNTSNTATRNTQPTPSASLDTTQPSGTEPVNPAEAAPTAPAEPAVTHASTTEPVNTEAPSNCNPNYSGCVPNVSYDLDCPDIGHSVTVTGTDVYRLDRDKDGIGCE